MKELLDDKVLGFKLLALGVMLLALGVML